MPFIQPQEQLPMIPLNVGSSEQSERETLKNVFSSCNQPVFHYLNQNNYGSCMSLNPEPNMKIGHSGDDEFFRSETTPSVDQHQIGNLSTVTFRSQNPSQQYFCKRIIERKYLQYCQYPYPEAEPHQNLKGLTGKEQKVGESHSQDKVEKTNVINDKTYELPTHQFYSLQTDLNCHDISKESSNYSQVPSAEMAPLQNQHENCSACNDEVVDETLLGDEMEKSTSNNDELSKWDQFLDELLEMNCNEQEDSSNLDLELLDRFLLSNEEHPLDEDEFETILRSTRF